MENSLTVPQTVKHQIYHMKPPLPPATLDTYPREWTKYVHTKSSTQMCVVALVIV